MVIASSGMVRTMSLWQMSRAQAAPQPCDVRLARVGFDWVAASANWAPLRRRDGTASEAIEGPLRLEPIPVATMGAAARSGCHAEQRTGVTDSQSQQTALHHVWQWHQRAISANESTLGCLRRPCSRGCVGTQDATGSAETSSTLSCGV
jgi:hypothetical protein